MRKILLLFLCFNYYSSFSQLLMPEPAFYKYLSTSNIKYLNQSFTDFKCNPIIDSLAIVLGLGFDNTSGCLLILDIDKQQHLFKLAERNMVLERLCELSEKLFQQGTPIIILEEGKSSAEHAVQLNAEKGRKFLYISLGNSCVSFGGLNQGIAVFNHSTRLLVKTK